MKHALIIDGHHFLFKSYGVPFKFSSKKGTPLQVITTFLSLTRRAYELAGQPEYVSVVFDSPAPNTNSELSEDYKANRVYEYEEDDNPFIHIPFIKKALNALSVPWYEIPGYEADDLIATSIAQQLTKNVNSASIASSDSDFFQLLENESLNIIRLVSSKKHQIYTKHWFQEEFGFAPNKYVEYKSMVGDSADNIKGMVGIGKVRGGQIIRGEMEFTPDAKQQEILDLNKQLIALNSNIDENLVPKYLDLDMFGKSNNEVFELCGF